MTGSRSTVMRRGSGLGEPRSVREEKGLTGYFGAVLGPEGVEGAFAIRAAVGGGAAESPQARDEGGGQAFGTQWVVVGQGGGEPGGGDAEADGGGDHLAPGILGGGEVLAELLIGKERIQCGTGLVSRSDAVEEGSPDDAAAAPGDGDPAEVDVPVV